MLLAMGSLVGTRLCAQEHPDYDPVRCHCFQCDISGDACSFPFPPESLSAVTCIFTLSAIRPDRSASVNTTVRARPTNAPKAMPRAA